jgi:hypothetical protein
VCVARKPIVAMHHPRPVPVAGQNRLNRPSGKDAAKGAPHRPARRNPEPGNHARASQEIPTMFDPSRDQARQFFISAWAKHRTARF